jgi:hypothetical protein
MKAWRTTAPAILSRLDARPEQITLEMPKNEGASGDVDENTGRQGSGRFN